MNEVLLMCILSLATVPGLRPAQSQTAAFDTAIDGIIFGGFLFKSFSSAHAENPHTLLTLLSSE